MHLPDDPRQVPDLLLPEDLGRARNAVKGREVVATAGETVLAVLVRVQAGVDDGAAGGAGGRAGERVRELRALGCQVVDVGGLDLAVSVASQLLAQVVGDQEEDVLGHCCGRGCCTHSSS